jgi:DNA-binding transcriptional LysR family regulator
METLKVEAVHAFVLIGDFKSFTRAAEAMNTTQSAISLKIKRLEDGLGPQATRPHAGLVRLSAEGSIFLASVRTPVAAHQGLWVRSTPSSADSSSGSAITSSVAELPILLKRMNSAEPRLVMEMRMRHRGKSLPTSIGAPWMPPSSYGTMMSVEKARSSSRKHSADWGIRFRASSG